MNKRIIIVCLAFLLFTGCGNGAEKERMQKEEEAQRKEEVQHKEEVQGKEEEVKHKEEVMAVDPEMQGDNASTGVSEGTTLMDSIEVGDVIAFGKDIKNSANPNKKLQWRVLEKNETKCLVLSTYLTETGYRYNYNGEAVWESSEVRSYLNNEYLNEAFDDSEKAFMLDTELVNSIATNTGSIGGNNTIDKIFLLSADEVLKYMPEEKLRRAIGRNIAANNYLGYMSWMLRTPVFSENEYKQLIAGVGMKGNLCNDSEECFSVDSEIGLRPAMWIDLEKAGDIVSVVESVDVFDEKETVDISVAEQFELVEYGVYEQDNNLENGKEPIQWIVFNTDEETNSVVLLSRYILDTKQFDDSYKNTSWGKCSLREWLNTSFYEEAFSDTEKAGLLDDTYDYVSLMDQSLSYYSEELMQAKGTPYAIANGLEADEIYGQNSLWWKNIAKNEKGGYWIVITPGGTQCNVATKTMGIGVRPVIRVDLDDVAR